MYPYKKEKAPHGYGKEAPEQKSGVCGKLCTQASRIRASFRGSPELRLSERGAAKPLCLGSGGESLRTKTQKIKRIEQTFRDTAFGNPWAVFS